MLRIEVRGLKEIARVLGDTHLVDQATQPGLRRAGVIVEASWKRRVHRVTGKYQGSLGHEVEPMEVRIGPQPGFGAPRHYTKAQTALWQKPKDGTNTGDPREYALFEDQGTRFRPGHPAAEPALTENRNEIADSLMRGIIETLDRRMP